MADNTLIAVVEDDAEIRDLTLGLLRREGYEAVGCEDASAFDRLAARRRVDLVLLDIMMPGEDGLSVCRRLRAGGEVAILMVTAKGDDIDRVIGLEIGADDYLAKPYNPRELLARVKAQLRRGRLLREELGKTTTSMPAHETLTFDNLVINLTRREALLNGKPLQVKPKEYELLLFFAEHRRQMLSREFILERVWGWDYIGDSRTVDVHVRWLRQKIEEDPSNPGRIVTVRGGGYRFEG